jgi:hypothetical protein
METGEQSIPAERLIDVCTAVDTSVAELLGQV